MEDESKGGMLGGAVAWMANNSVAANLLLLLLFCGGIYGGLSAKQEVFPEFNLDLVSVSVPYPGASPEEVEYGVVVAVEEAVRGLDGVKRVSSVSNEGVGSVTIELLIDADADAVTADVKAAVDRIRSFPDEAEDPIVQSPAIRRRVVTLLVAGQADAMTLYEVGERARTGLLATGEVTQVDVVGLPALEVSIEVSREQLDSLGLTLDDISRQIARSSIELPGGAIETAGGEILVRLSDRARSADDFKEIIVRSTLTGGEVRLGDIASVVDGFEDTDQASFYNGVPAVGLVAYRVGDETPTSVSNAVLAYSTELRGDLGEKWRIATWDDDSELLEQRIDLLVRNGTQGLVLVFIVLALFLRFRLAFWVAVGIPTSFLGALLLMPGFDVSINMISLFAFIITLGIVVDDAIVVGENIYEKIQSGMPKAEAAIRGAQEMVTPVTFSVLTTMVAFSPLFLVPGVSGKIFRILPIVVISVLAFSVIESFFVLPAHLAHVHTGKEHGFLAVVDIPRRYASDGLGWFIQRVYTPVLDWAIALRYAAFAAASGLLLISFGICVSGTLPFNFLPVLEGDTITASARLPYGTPVERTQAVQQAMETAALQIVQDLDPDSLKGMYSTLGTGPASGGGPGGGAGEVGSHLITVQVELVPSVERDFSAEDFSFAWEAATPPQSGLEALVFNANVGPSGGAAVDVQLRHADVDVLAQASQDLTDTLRTLGDLTSVENAYSSGKEQLDLHMLPSANSLGLTGLDVATQVRSGFYGSEAIREQRGRSEIKVMLRLPEHQRGSEYDLDSFLVRTPAGDRVPLTSVARVERDRAPTVIRREDGQRVVNVTAKKAAGVASSRDVLETIKSTVLPALAEKYPGLRGEFVGEQRDQAESLNSLGLNYLIALIGIYALLAVPFKSYTQPLIVMTAIPFSFTGVVAGHMLLGYGLSIISMMGIVALSGVVVNDSLVLIDAANNARREGKTPRQAIVAAGTRRFRPIMLTSLTTFFGLAPMIIETEVQARFLIPMAISLGFGVLYATFIVLLVVPGTYIIVEDFLVWVKRIGTFFAEKDDELDAPPPPSVEGV